jgi:ATP dependent DNA ligase domain
MFSQHGCQPASLALSRAAAQRKPVRLDARALPGAKPAPFPGSIEPCHPTLPEKAPSGERWFHEIKLDSYRAQGQLRQGQPAIYTRRGYDSTRRFQPIADALATLPADDLILDGEAIVADSRGVPDFGLLHADLAATARTGCSTSRSTCCTSTESICVSPGSSTARACSVSCWRVPPSASSTPSTWRETAPRFTSAPAPSAWKASSASSWTPPIAPGGRIAGSRSSAASAGRSRSWPSSRSSAPSRAQDRLAVCGSA